MELIVKTLTLIMIVLYVAMIVGSIISIHQTKQNEKIIFAEQVSDIVVYTQIKNMVSGNEPGRVYSPKKYMDYYRRQILPASNVSQELKEAWVYQAKKSKIWKDA